MPTYSSHLREIIKKGVDSKKDYDRPLTGFKIAVDAGNGSGGFLATDVLAPLGADTAGNHILSSVFTVLKRELINSIFNPASHMLCDLKLSSDEERGQSYANIW